MKKTYHVSDKLDMFRETKQTRYNVFQILISVIGFDYYSTILR